MVAASNIKSGGYGESAVPWSVDILCMMAPWPFFWLGIPYASILANIFFRTTCIGFAGFMFLGFNANSIDVQKMLRGFGLYCNIISSWIVSAWWCSGHFLWVALMVLELTFVVLSSRCFSLGGLWWHIAITFLGACISYYMRHPVWLDCFEETLIRRLSSASGLAVGEEAALSRNTRTVQEEQEEEEDRSVDNIWACVMGVMVLLLVVALEVVVKCHRWDNLVMALPEGMGMGSTEPVADSLVGIVPEPRAVSQVDDLQTISAKADADATLPNTISSLTSTDGISGGSSSSMSNSNHVGHEA